MLAMYLAIDHNAQVLLIDLKMECQMNSFQYLIFLFSFSGSSTSSSSSQEVETGLMSPPGFEDVPHSLDDCLRR